MPEPLPETYTYKHIVIVHGMGEAAPNETALNFMNEFMRALPRDKGSVDVFNLVESVDDIKDAKKIEYGDKDDLPRPRRSFTPAYIIFKNGSANHVIGFSEVYWKQIPDHYLEQNGGHLPIPISTWAHSINTRFLRYEIEGGNKWRTYRRFRKINEVIDNVEKMLKILTRLATIYKKSGELASVTRNYLGDVQMYAESDKIRQEINNRFLNVMSRVSLFSHETREEIIRQKNLEAESDTAEEIDFNKCEIYVVAHSQGTVISYNSLVQAAMLIERTDEKRAEFPGLFDYEPKLIEEIKKEARERAEERARKEAGKEAGRKAYERAEKEAKAGAWLPMVKGFVTFGTPIDKFYTIWENRFRRDNLEGKDMQSILGSNTPVNKIPWFNFWDRSDPFAYGLNVLFKNNSETDAKRLFEVEDDIGFSRYFIPALAHIKYWKDEAIYKDIIYRVMELDTKPDESEVKNNPLVWLNRWTAYAGYFLGRIATLFFIVVFLNRILYPLHKKWIERPNAALPIEEWPIDKWIYFAGAFIAPFALIWVLEEISFFFEGIGAKLIKWLRKFFVVGWWVWAFILCLLPPVADLLIKPFLPGEGKEITMMDRIGYLTSLAVLCLIWKLHTALHRGLMQMWHYTRGKDTGVRRQAG